MELVTIWSQYLQMLANIWKQYLHILYATIWNDSLPVFAIVCDDLDSLFASEPKTMVGVLDKHKQLI